MSNNGPLDTYPRETGEDIDDEIIYTPPFQGRLKGEDKWITLSTDDLTHSVEGRFVSYTLLYDHIKLKPHEGITLRFGNENS